MEFNENDLVMVAKSNDVSASDFNNIIEIIDEFGHGFNYTYDKFVEIFDTEGLSGFVM